MNPTVESDTLTHEQLAEAAHTAAAAGDLETLAALRSLDRRRRIEPDPETWLRAVAPRSITAPLAAHHRDFWAHVWTYEDARPALPFLAIWARGGAKSTSAELAVVATGALATRRYCLYVCATQTQADDHVAAIATILESEYVGETYPALATRRVGLYGRSRGWRRNRLETAAGFTVDAVGLDTAIRGIRIDANRPDLIVLDDVDEELDSALAVEKKIIALTRKILPTMATHGTVLGAQNLVHEDSIFARFADGRADFLAGRIVSGPIPAVEGLAVEQTDAGYRIVGGAPTWEGMGLRACEAEIATYGLAGFLAECQHEVTGVSGGMFDHIAFAHCARDDLPSLRRTTVWVDPAVTTRDSSDCQAISVCGVADDDRIYVLHTYETRSTPLQVLRQAILWAYAEGSPEVGVETDQGGDTWTSVFREALTFVLSERPDLAGKPPPRFSQAKAGAGAGPKAHRASQMLPDYEQGRVIHVYGSHEIIERALRRFPKVKPLDAVDALVWAHRALRKSKFKATTTGARTARQAIPIGPRRTLTGR